jgi:hypothetical protein
MVYKQQSTTRLYDTTVSEPMQCRALRRSDLPITVYGLRKAGFSLGMALANAANNVIGVGPTVEALSGENGPAKRGEIPRSTEFDRGRRKSDLSALRTGIAHDDDWPSHGEMVPTGSSATSDTCNDHGCHVRVGSYPGRKSDRRKVRNSYTATTPCHPRAVRSHIQPGHSVLAVETIASSNKEKL